MENAITIHFALSQAGQKDSLLKGENAKEKQSRSVPVTQELLALASVDVGGSASLSVCKSFDVYPSDEDLFQAIRDCFGEKERQKKAKEDELAAKVDAILGRTLETYLDFIEKDKIFYCGLKQITRSDGDCRNGRCSIDIVNYFLERCDGSYSRPEHRQRIDEHRSLIATQLRPEILRRMTEAFDSFGDQTFFEMRNRVENFVKTCDVPEYVARVTSRLSRLIEEDAKRQQEAKAKEDAYAAYAKSERSEWIGRYGSERLRKMVALGLNCGSLYEEEREKFREGRMRNLIRKVFPQSVVHLIPEHLIDENTFCRTPDRPTLDQLAKLEFAQTLDGEACFWTKEQRVWIVIDTDAVDTKKDEDGELFFYRYVWEVGRCELGKD